MLLNAESMIIPHTRRQVSPSRLQSLVRFFSEPIFRCHYVKTACCSFLKICKILWVYFNPLQIHFSLLHNQTVSIFPSYTYCGYIMQVLFDKALSRDLHLRKIPKTVPSRRLFTKQLKGQSQRYFFTELLLKSICCMQLFFVLIYA
jgi:hypothetical protein